MTNIKNLARENILSLIPYSSARNEYDGDAAIFLDANENPYGTLNRYPDPLQRKLKTEISIIKNIPQENIFLGNGSDEAIDLVYRIFCVPGKDKVLSFTPTYGMYGICAAINDVTMVTVPLDDDFDIPTDIPSGLIDNSGVKVIILCSPNNPTGNSLTNGKIMHLLSNFNGVIVIDEAYIDFSITPSYLHLIRDYPNLIVLQTFSKAWGLAAARVGMAFADREIISLLNKVKYPYNISEINQQAALNALSEKDKVKSIVEELIRQREYLYNRLSRIELVRKVYPSDANFLLVKMSNANLVYEELVKLKIIVRNRSSVICDCLRITIGTKEENIRLVEVLEKISLS
jgi:histidinol-phosphate aminotransferase